MPDEQKQSRPIGEDERSGVLAPTNLPRFSAAWHEPALAVSDVVDTYWSVDWNLQPGEAVLQRIVDFPAVTLSVETGAVPAPFVVTAVQRRAWTRTIARRGSVFAIRLRPAGLAVVSDLDPAGIGPETPVTPTLDARAHRLLEVVSAELSPAKRASRADEVILELLRDRPASPQQLLANAAVDALASRIRTRTGQSLSAELGVSERSIQRALRATLGMGPKAIARRIRLQEVVRCLSVQQADVATIAAQLGYVDQAHLVNDFRGVAGVTPGQYLRELRQLAGA